MKLFIQLFSFIAICSFAYGLIQYGAEINGPDGFVAPWMAALCPRIIGRAGSEVSVDICNHCGAVLIHPKAIITAGHCVEGFQPYEFAVHLGVTDLRNSRQGQEVDLRKKVRYGVNKIIMHPNYTKIGAVYENPGFRNDIAVLYLDRPASASSVIQMANQTKSYGICFIGGYGRIESEPDDSNLPRDVLRWGLVPIVEPQVCNKTAPYVGIISPDMVCAGWGGRNHRFSEVCFGDSGGPLACHIDGTTPIELAGIISFGNARYCPLGNATYSVYVSIPTMKPWIEENLPADTKLEALRQLPTPTAANHFGSLKAVFLSIYHKLLKLLEKSLRP